MHHDTHNNLYLHCTSSHDAINTAHDTTASHLHVQQDHGLHQDQFRDCSGEKAIQTAL